MAVGAHGGLDGTHDGRAHGADVMSSVLGGVDPLHGVRLDEHLLGVHLVLGEVLDVDVAEVAQSGVEGDEGEVDALDFHALHQLPAEVQSGGGCGHGTSLRAKMVWKFSSSSGSTGRLMNEGKGGSPRHRAPS